jgi:Domain of unknown function (DUF4159)
MRPRHLRVITLALLAMLAVGASLAVAQQIWVGGGRFGRRFAPKWVKATDFNGSYLYCRGYYESVRREDGGQGWSTDYPDADHNFLTRLAELTRVYIKDSDRNPNFVVIPLTDPLLFKCPVLFMEDIGTARFSELEVKNLRDFFLKGGFLWVDDYWGSYAWQMWQQEISRVLPPGEYPIFDIPIEHPIMHTLYDVKEFPQIPSINFWGRGWRGTSERGPDSAEVHFRGIQDARKRLMVLMTHNTDIADAWEREGEDHEYFNHFSPRGYAIGVNVVLYALSH